MSRQHRNSARRRKRDAAKRRQRNQRQGLKTQLDTLLAYGIAGVPFIHRGTGHLSAVVVPIHTECLDHWPVHVHEAATENGLKGFSAESGT